MKKSFYYIITIGCQMNIADSERFAAKLEQLGYVLAEKRSQADLVVVTTCGVRQSAEDRIYGLIPRIKKDNPKTKVIVTGCLAYRQDVQRRLKGYVDFWLPITKLSSLSDFLDEKDLLEKGRKMDYLSISPNYSSDFSAYVPIGNGCNNYCAYCVVPYARGPEVYRPAGDIIAEVKKIIKKGFKEIFLIAQNVNSYSSPGGSKAKKINFANLLKQVNDIPGEFWIRFATSHPKDMSDELIRTIADCKKVCRHIHLPVQAGDDNVLAAMNRKYTVEHYLKLIEKIRQAMPDASITTDTIVGFPGETKAQFGNTKKLYKKVGFDMAYLAQYSPRPGTAAARLADNVSKIEKRRREVELNDILSQTALRNNKKYLNQTVEILCEGKNKNGQLFGKTKTYKMVKASLPLNDKKNSDRYKGNFVNVKINNVFDFGIEGEIIKEPPVIKTKAARL